MGSTDRVASPTFTISRVYKSQDLELHHFDFYRMDETGLMAYELDDLLSAPGIVTVIEWAGIAETVLPTERVRIHIRVTGESDRQITIDCPEQFRYLLETI